jgi:hypothetical protein
MTMKEFHYLGTWTDTWRQIQTVMDAFDVRLFFDKNYALPEPTYIQQLDEVTKSTLMRKPSVFVWSAAFSTDPPKMECTDGKPPIYFIYGAEGGPSLQWRFPGCFEESGITNLAVGRVVCRSEYFIPSKDITVRPSMELIRAYRGIVATLKQNMVRHKLQHYVWIGKDALLLLKEDKAQILGFT